MSKTEVVLAFSQMPEDMCAPFKALYPEIVDETPVAIIIDPDARSIEFTVGAREMSFGPSNENYSVFMLGCYRMLFSAAQKQGWMSNYPQEEATQAVASPVVQEQPENLAPPAPAPEPPPEQEALKQASLDPQGRVAALEAKLASMPRTPEVEALQAKVASLTQKVKTASTTVIPKANHELFVRPLDFVAGLREDWQKWADQHGGQESMNEQGILDLEVPATTDKHQASALAEKSGWNHEAGNWVHPKGLKTADDSKLVAQLRKTAGSEFEERVRVPGGWAVGDQEIKEDHERDELPYVQALKDMGTTKASAKIADTVPNTPRAEDDHKGDAAYETALDPKVGSTVTASEGDASQLLEHNLNPVETLADGSTGQVEINDVTTVKEVATVKSASSPMFRSGQASASLKSAGLKKAYTPEVSSAVNAFLTKNAGKDIKFSSMIADIKEHTSSWKSVLSYLSEAGLLQKSNTDYVRVLNRDMAADAGSHSSSVKLAHFARKWVRPDGEMVDVNGDTNTDAGCDFHAYAAQREGHDGVHAAVEAGWVRIGMLNSTTGYLEYNATKIKTIQLHNIQAYLMQFSPSKITLDYGSGSARLDADEFYVLNSPADLNKETRRSVYASTNKVARHCDADPTTVTFSTLPIRIDCPSGSTVSGVDANGEAWENTQSVDYGEILDTNGGDGEPIDVFLGPNEDSPWVFIVNQTKRVEGQEEPVADELKVGLGFWSMDDAKEAYLGMFPSGWDQYDTNIVTASIDAFKDWMENNPGVSSVTADDFTLTTSTPELVQPQTVVAPEVFNSMSNSPITSYVASVDHVASKSMEDVFTTFHDASASPLDHTSATLANLLATQTVDPTRGHQASFDAHNRASIEDSIKVSVESHKANLVPAGTSKSRIAEIITADLSIGYSAQECDHKASLVNYYGSDQANFRRTLAKLAGIAGELVLQPNIFKQSCTATHAALNGQYKSIRSKTAFHSVASTSQCADCTHCKCGSTGKKHCALFGKPIISSLEAMHTLADSVWGPSKEAKTTIGLNKRSVAHSAGRRVNPAKSPIQMVTAAVDFGDSAESRPTPKVSHVSGNQISPSSFITASLSQGLTPARITEVITRSTVYSASFKEAAINELNSQKGIMGFLTVVPHFAGSCSITHGKHFASTAKPNDKRKVPFHSVTRIAACDGCQNCVKNASGGQRCSLYGKPLVATLGDLKRVASVVFPALEPKIAAASRQELAKESLPYLAKALGVSENHPSLEAFRMPEDDAAQVVTETEIAKVDGEKDATEGASKNVMDLAMQASKPKTQDLEAVTTKVKEAFTKGKTSKQVYNEVQAKMAGVDKVDLRRIVNRVASETNVSQAQSSSNGEIFTEVSTNDSEFGNAMKQMADGQIAKTQPELTDNVVNISELSDMQYSSDEFDSIQSYI